MKQLFAVFVSLCAAPVAAQVTMLQSQPPYQQIPAGYLCYMVDARQGWQRIDTSTLGKASTFAFGPENQSIQAQIGIGPLNGWTVDAANYDRVGPSGHRGSAAARLNPFNAYKFDQKWPFGALLMRTDQGDIYHVETSTTAKALTEYSRYLDLRINDADAALGDNAGEVLICIRDRALFN